MRSVYIKLIYSLFQATVMRPSLFNLSFNLLFSLCFTLLLSPTNGIAAERIISLAPSSTEMLYAIGAGSKLIATVEHSDYPPQARKLPHIGNYHSINIEKIVALKPDLIVAWPEGNPAAQLALLEQLKLNIHYTRASSLDALAIELAALGQATGNSQQANELAQITRQELNKLKQDYQDKKKVSLFYQVWPEPLMSVSNKNWLGDAIKLCGAENIFANNLQAFPLVSKEKVLLADPQIMIAAEKNHGALKHWQQWSQLSAVKNQQLYTINPDHIHRFGPRLLLGVQELCKAIDNGR